MVHDDAQHLRLQRLPGNFVVLGNRDEIAPKKTRATPGSANSAVANGLRVR